MKRAAPVFVVTTLFLGRILMQNPLACAQSPAQQLTHRSSALDALSVGAWGDCLHDDAPPINAAIRQLENPSGG